MSCKGGPFSVRPSPRRSSIAQSSNAKPLLVLCLTGIGEKGEIKRLARQPLPCLVSWWMCVRGDWRRIERRKGRDGREWWWLLLLCPLHSAACCFGSHGQGHRGRGGKDRQTGRKTATLTGKRPSPRPWLEAAAIFCRGCHGACCCPCRRLLFLFYRRSVTGSHCSAVALRSTPLTSHTASGVVLDGREKSILSFPTFQFKLFFSKKQDKSVWHKSASLEKFF